MRRSASSYSADRLHPPSFRLLDQTEAAKVDLGRSVFDAEWAAAGIAGTTGRIGVGPLFKRTPATHAIAGVSAGQARWATAQRRLHS